MLEIHTITYLQAVGMHTLTEYMYTYTSLMLRMKLVIMFFNRIIDELYNVMLLAFQPPQSSVRSKLIQEFLVEERVGRHLNCSMHVYVWRRFSTLKDFGFYTLY